MAPFITAENQKFESVLFSKMHLYTFLLIKAFENTFEKWVKKGN